MNLGPGEKGPLGMFSTTDWPVVVSISWSGRGGDVWPKAPGVRFERVPVPPWRRLWFWVTDRYAYDYEGWPE